MTTKMDPKAYLCSCYLYTSNKHKTPMPKQGQQKTFLYKVVAQQKCLSWSKYIMLVHIHLINITENKK